jgi:hypothetical protein
VLISQDLKTIYAIFKGYTVDSGIEVVLHTFNLGKNENFSYSSKHNNEVFYEYFYLQTENELTVMMENVESNKSVIKTYGVKEETKRYN